MVLIVVAYSQDIFRVKVLFIETMDWPNFHLKEIEREPIELCHSNDL